MLTEARWQKEQELMQGVFPAFKPFSRGTRFGFEGYLKGPRSGRIYGVSLEGDQAAYPQSPPRVCMCPRVGLHWIGDGESRRLCMQREWRPARSTFANTVLALIRYLDEHDPEAADASLGQPHGENPLAGDEFETVLNTGFNFWATVSSCRCRGPY